MIAVAAAILGTLGDLLLLATANATRPGFEWLPAPSAACLVGTYLGVLAIPCYGLGYRQVAARFEPRPGRWIAGLGIAGGVLGGTTHGLTGLVIHVEITGGAGGVDPITVLGRYGAYLLPLWAAIAAISVVGTAIYAIGVLAGRSSLPRWTAAANPLVLVVLLVGAGRTVPLGSAFLVPAAPNLAHVLFFAMVWALRDTGPHRR
jgi:hypothetical protein